MDLSDIGTGKSLYFNAPLPRGAGMSGVGEFQQSHLVSGLITPTPPHDWEALQELLGLPDRPTTILTKAFTVAYVPYVDGRIHYHEGDGAVLSAEYSGCLMAVYRAVNMRRVAHVPKSSVEKNDSIGEFRDYFSGHSTLLGEKKKEQRKKNYEFVHYFQPFVESRDADIQYGLISKLIQKQIIDMEPYAFTTFGLVTSNESGSKCISIWAVKPKRQPKDGQMWHILMVRARAALLDFKALVGKKNRAALDVLPE